MDRFLQAGHMKPTRWIPSLLLVFSLSGCVTKRTVTENGRTVDQKIVVKRPIKNAIENVEFE